MGITFDHHKNLRNIAKHGLSLAEAEHMDWQHALHWIDERHAYGETRECALGDIAGRLCKVVYVFRNGQRRIISLRKANDREIKRYRNQMASTRSSF